MKTGSSGAPDHLPILFLAIGLALQTAAFDAVGQVRIVTGTEEPDLRTSRELVAFIAEPAGVAMEPLPLPSVPESLDRLRTEPGVNLAVVQLDVYQAFLARAARAEAGSRDSVAPPRVVLRLPGKELHFIARADAPFDYLHQIKDAKINVGPPGSGTAVTAAAIYRLMFGKGLPENQTSLLRHEEALVKLVTDQSVDVVVMAAGQPEALLANMKPEARQYIKLLGLEPGRPESRAALRAYSRATVRAKSYPAWLAADVPTLAVGMYLVTLDFRAHVTETRLIRFGRSLCQNFSALQAKGHPKWREVGPSLAPLPEGWAYYPPTGDELRSCRHSAARN